MKLAVKGKSRQREKIKDLLVGHLDCKPNKVDAPMWWEEIETYLLTIWIVSLTKWTPSCGKDENALVWCKSGHPREVVKNQKNEKKKKKKWKKKVCFPVVFDKMCVFCLYPIPDSQQYVKMGSCRCPILFGLLCLFSFWTSDPFLTSFEFGPRTLSVFTLSSPYFILQLFIHSCRFSVFNYFASKMSFGVISC